jgi:Ran GTPase-activating protein (RanGAP) involved in mRNA processing and transport
MVFRSFALRNDFSDTFGNILSQMKHLRRLTLARTQFTLSQLESIIRNLDFSQLESLNLGDTRIGPRGVLVLATYLSRARQLALKELDLRGCFMEDAGAAAIIQLLPKLPNLKVLNLMENNITDASAIPLLGVLPTMEHLTHFLVSANPKVSASTWKNFERFASSPGVHFVEFGYGSY